MVNSAVSAADGFKIQTRLLWKFLLGMRVCLDCPRCALVDSGDEFCADAEGIVSEVEGGCIGRGLAAVGTAEFQKKRDEHIHSEVVVECLHTSSSLHDIADMIEKGFVALVDQYKDYVDHVCLQRYSMPGVDVVEKRRRAETTWPMHRDAYRLAAIPSHYGARPPLDSSVASLLNEGTGPPLL